MKGALSKRCSRRQENEASRFLLSVGERKWRSFSGCTRNASTSHFWPGRIGKLALVAHLRESLSLRICPASERLSETCEALDREFDLETGDLHLVQRKNRLLKLLKGTKHAVVFDGTGWTTPKLSSFIENVSERVPVWICARQNIRGTSATFGRCWPIREGRDQTLSSSDASTGF